MDPVIVAAVVTVAVSVVNGVVKVAQQRLTAEVEMARITEAGQTDRIRCAARPVPAHRNGGARHGGRAQH
ncbi:putative membrane protein [Streptomyces davaonensis JCM 4913]|uniref:Putative membrane protein n=1 Tax=Streptomyces davaonensis (strain DSM 101723 / JCM 4913 / KCC S-0913 / 768) TaxID=1214101 RepID=K4R7J9_STRDJ|nr:hypothetical protein [Streptomyces davaonensis]CCK32256.1 putative membrane protein [Streptomyces davaonensis JCM 4913]